MGTTLQELISLAKDLDGTIEIIRESPREAGVAVVNFLKEEGREGLDLLTAAAQGDEAANFKLERLLEGLKIDASLAVLGGIVGEAGSAGSAGRGLLDELFGVFRRLRQQRGASRSSISSDAIRKGTEPKARFVYDTEVGRYRDLASGRFVAQRNLPYPSNAGFADRVRGTLQPETLIDRIGRSSGRFASEGGTSASARGIPPGVEGLPFTRLRVLKPIDVDMGTAAPVPEFGAVGGAKQYIFDTSIQDLINSGFLEVVP